MCVGVSLCDGSLGDTISITSGVVSRVEVQRYFHGGGTQLAVQIDAPINPGNSGGPALYDDGSLRVAGVAFQVGLCPYFSIALYSYGVVEIMFELVWNRGQMCRE